MSEHKHDENSPVTLSGIGASPGIVIGPLLFLGRRKKKRRERRNLQPGQVEGEIRRFRKAVDDCEADLSGVRQQFSRQFEEYASLIDSHMLMLRDHMLYERSIEGIQNELIDAEWALEKALNEVRAAFGSMDDQYLRERILDVEQVAERIFGKLLGKKEEHFADLDEQVIVAAHDLTPEDILHLRTDKVLGFFTEKGGETSHIAIIARTLGIPSVVGVEDIYLRASSGNTAILDGSSGRIFLHPTADQLALYRELQRQQELYGEEVLRSRKLAAETIDGIRVRVEANIEMVEEARQAMDHGAGGIGLFRSEFYYIDSKELPTEERLLELYKGMLESISPAPVAIRTLDVGGDKLASCIAANNETNPALGLRAIRLSLREPHIFFSQLRALYRASVHGNLRIMFPMISSLCEVKKIKEVIRLVQKELREEGHPYRESTPIGIMIEVPSAVAIADVLAREVDYFSIGTNDLIQYALAIDRGNEHVAHMYEPLHPAVIRMIKHVVDAGHEAGIEVGLCGEMAGDINYLPLLLGLGLDQLSMHPLAIPYVKRLIRSSIAEESQGLAAEILECASAQEAHDYLGRYLPMRYPLEFGRDGIRSARTSCCEVTMSR